MNVLYLKKLTTRRPCFGCPPNEYNQLGNPEGVIKKSRNSCNQSIMLSARSCDSSYGPATGYNMKKEHIMKQTSRN